MSRAADCIHLIDAQWCADCNPAAGPESPLEGWINDVFAVIPTDGEQPKSRDVIALESGHTLHETDTAVAAIRERHPDLPLVSDRNGLRFTLDHLDLVKYQHARASQALTLMRRMFRGALVPYMLHTADPSEVRRAQRQMERLLEDMEEFV
jgi:hypothetical protein